MINEIRTAFKDNFKNLRWMDKETLLEAELKADAITDMIGKIKTDQNLGRWTVGIIRMLRIGFPDYIMDPNQLDDKYINLTVRSDEYFSNNIRYVQFNLEQSLYKLDRLVNHSR